MSEEFDWASVDVVVPAQGETCVYRNDKGQTVIRQRSPFTGDDDSFIVIADAFLPALILRLQQHHAENMRSGNI